MNSFNKKKKVLFVMDSYRVGGTTVSTRNIVGLLDQDKYEPYIWVLSDIGLLKDLFADCKIIKTCFVLHAIMLSSFKDEERLIPRIGVMIIRFLKHHSSKLKECFYSYSVKKCLKNMEFDTVVACAEGATTDFVSYMIHPNRVTWVRCDYANYFTQQQIESKRSQYSVFNHIVCVSEKVKDGFDNVYPEYANKTICIHNPQDVNLLIKRAEIDDGDNRFKTDKTCIVSIGRICELKRFHVIPSIAKQLIDKGLDFRWYIIGDGDEEEKINISAEIEKYKVSDNVILLGAKSNVHYYINKANLLVSLSRTEACPRVVNEAKVLHTPVVSTDYRTIYEYIVDHENGIITPIDQIGDAVYDILTNKVLYDKIESNISTFTFDNSLLLEKIESVL